MRRSLVQSVLFLALITALPMRSQQPKVPDSPAILDVAPAPYDRFPAKWYTGPSDRKDPMPAPVVGRPYFATVETVTPYLSSHGEPLRQIEYGFQARDSFGRTRSEAPNGGMTIGEDDVKTKSVIVTDPVAHCQFHWTELISKMEPPAEMRIAFVACGPRTLRYKDLEVFATLSDTVSDGTSTHGDTVTKTEHLSPVEIDGLSVDRLRVSNTLHDDHGQEKRWASETWYSPDLREIIRIGDEAEGYTGLAGIRRSSPDPSLFYPPVGYRIEVEPNR